MLSIGRKNIVLENLNVYKNKDRTRASIIQHYVHDMLACNTITIGPLALYCLR